MINLRPHGCKALLRLDERITHYGVIEIPDAYRHQAVIATVVEVGPGYRAEDGEWWPVGFEPGERVYLGPWNGEVVDIDDTEHEYRVARVWRGDLIRQAKTPKHIADQWSEVYAVVDDPEQVEIGRRVLAEWRAYLSRARAA